jgi:hypothetical protein
METTLHEKIVIDGAEAAVSKLTKLAAAAKNVMTSFGGLGDIISTLGGIAGVMKIAQTIQDTDRLYQAVQRVTDMTGSAAGNVHAMFDMFEVGGGIGADSAERIITSLTRLKSEIARGSGDAVQTAGVMRQLGISIKTGPEESLIAMAGAAEKGKLGIDHLVRAFNIPRSQASQMLTMLRQGPEKLRGIQADTLKSSELIDDGALRSYQSMIQMRRELTDAWGGIVEVLYKSLLPAVTEVLKAIKEGFDDIKPIADAVGAGLAKYMSTIVALAKTYLLLMIAAKGANMFTGQNLGVLGWGKNLASRGMGAMAGRGAAIAGMDYFAARAAFPAASMFGTIGGPLTTVFSSLAGRLGLIGIVIAAVVAAFYMLKNNVLGIADMFRGAFRKIWASLKDIGEQLWEVLKRLFEAVKPLLAVLGGVLLIAILVLVGVLQGAVTILEGIVDALAWVYEQIQKMRIDLSGTGITGEMYDEMMRRFNAYDGIDEVVQAGKDVPKGKNAVIQDFRGSHFEITNNFPQGIDGGRVAVAFGDELAALGERRLESGLRPLYSYR